ncbi:MAG: WecB/TagA/CpsF family glycosyltransferase [Candidatus Buchananbacteria bacterium]
MKIDLLGVKIDKINFNEVINRIADFLNSSRQMWIATVNAEIVLLAQKYLQFKKVLNEADISTCDGSGPMWASSFLNKEKLTRATGADLVKNLLEMSRAKNPLISNAKYFLLGGNEGIAETVAKKYSNSNIVGYNSGGKLHFENNKWILEKNDKIISEINQSGANILIVAFGMRKQETWIAQNLKQMPNINVAIGVGGTLDFLSGKIKRAPKVFRKLGIEWLYRLIQEPKRFKRIWNAVVVFGFKILIEKFKK